MFLNTLTALLFMSLVSFNHINFASAESAMASIKSTNGSALKGTVRIEDTDTGVKISAKVSGAAPGQHGFHIHEYGSCANGGKAAGSHFNPDGALHGDVLIQGVFEVHPGDLGNITIDANGEGTKEIEVEDLSVIEGIYNIGGRAIIMHAAEDDLGQPTGNAGARIGCGTITIVNPEF
ncbi:MAG: Cu-Zn family superoxide dismutase [Candidatus Omnitrophota bacterium]|jgi:Cu-Zn family superoxide dismutase